MNNSTKLDDSNNQITFEAYNYDNRLVNALRLTKEFEIDDTLALVAPI